MNRANHERGSSGSTESDLGLHPESKGCVLKSLAAAGVLVVVVGAGSFLVKGCTADSETDGWAPQPNGTSSPVFTPSVKKPAIDWLRNTAAGSATVNFRDFEDSLRANGRSIRLTDITETDPDTETLVGCLRTTYGNVQLALAYDASPDDGVQPSVQSTLFVEQGPDSIETHVTSYLTDAQRVAVGEKGLGAVYRQLGAGEPHSYSGKNNWSGSGLPQYDGFTLSVRGDEVFAAGDNRLPYGDEPAEFTVPKKYDEQLRTVAAEIMKGSVITEGSEACRVNVRQSS